MILDYLQEKGKLTGDYWEAICQSCYRMRYQSDHYIEVLATHKGDAGIEGFTSTGIVNQCYCPERDYSDDDLYQHLRNKMSTDLAKLINPTYVIKRKELGVPKITEWHFVIPFYRDSRIISHAETKKQEILRLKELNPSEYNYIDDNFLIVIKIAEDFNIEITRIIRSSLIDDKLNVKISYERSTDWSKCSSDKVNNIKRKIRAVMSNVDEDDEDYKDMISMYLEAYIKGIEILNDLRVSYAEIYEEIFSLQETYKRKVSLKTKMNQDSSINISLFNEILNEFEENLKQQCTYLSITSINELAIDLISGWLADCSMQFKSR